MSSEHALHSRFHLYDREFNDVFFLALSQELPRGCHPEVVIVTEFEYWPTKCFDINLHLEAKARRFGLDLKFKEKPSLTLPTEGCSCHELVE